MDVISAKESSHSPLEGERLFNSRTREGECGNRPDMRIRQDGEHLRVGREDLFDRVFTRYS
jgi:hypothetical protein